MDLDGDTLTVKIHPYAHSSYLSSVWVNVDATPLKIVLGGVLNPDTDKRLLIGQKLSANVLGGSGAGDTYTWIVSGGPFASYAASTPSQFVPYDPPAASTNPSTSLYFARPGTKSVQCSVYLAVLGQTVTLSEQVTTVAPEYSAWIVMGHASINSNPTLALRLWDADYTDSNGDESIAGAWMVGWVDTPSAFRTSGVGGWEWIQIVTQTQSEVHAIDGSYAVGSQDGNTPALDEMAPYLGLSFGANGAEKAASDAPEVPVGDSDNYDYVLSKSFFNDYQMYSPPGDSMLVPLAKLSWNWYGKAYRDHMNHVWKQPSAGDSDQAWYYVSDFPPHPMWNQAITSNTLVQHP